jgi:membrane protein required for colicin V production
MIDFVLGAALAALTVRGWIRGLVKELFDLIGLVLGIWIAFRLSAPIGDFLTDHFGVTPEVARIGSGVALFFLFGISLAVAARYLTRVMNLPGLNTANRLGGSVVALSWGLVLLLVAVNVTRVLPAAGVVGDRFEGSVVVEAVAGPDAVPQQLFERFVGDSALIALQAIQRFFGMSRIVPEGSETVEIPSAALDEIRHVRNEADRVFTEINRHRAGVEVRAVAMSEGLRAMAEARAEEIYTSGAMQRAPDGCVRSASREFGVTLAVCEELMALAASAMGAFDGISSSSTGERVLGDPVFDRAGVAVVDGPTGRLLVIVLGG